MSRAVLRGLGRMARQALAEGSETSSQRFAHTETGARYSPRQFGRETPIDRSSTFVAKNPFIESFVYRRDKFEKEFSWTLRNTFEMAYMIAGVTAGFYALSVFTIRQSDERNGYPRRNMIFAETNTSVGWTPDERDWH